MEELVKILKAQGTILYPTDTIWGVGCDATCPEAVQKVYDLKKRDDSKSLIVLVADEDMLARCVKDIPEVAIQLLEVNDAPMTIIYPEATGYLAANLVAADGTIAIRIPQSEFCRKLIRRFGRPIVSTSANVSGEPSPKSFAEISAVIREGVDLVADPSLEDSVQGRASQIIKVTNDYQVKIIRA